MDEDLDLGDLLALLPKTNRMTMTDTILSRIQALVSIPFDDRNNTNIEVAGSICRLLLSGKSRTWVAHGVTARLMRLPEFQQENILTAIEALASDTLDPGFLAGSD